MQPVYYDYMNSPIGKLMLAGTAQSLLELGFPGGKGARRHQPGWVRDAGRFAQVRQQLEEYFAGHRQTFTIALAPQGTPFQLQVWEALRAIPFGETVSYGELARQLGRPRASRAVGAANGRNPIPIIIPCHRVIGGNGKLVGFGGGLQTKQTLLDMEKKVASPTLFAGQETGW